VGQVMGKQGRMMRIAMRNGAILKTLVALCLAGLAAAAGAALAEGPASDGGTPAGSATTPAAAAAGKPAGAAQAEEYKIGTFDLLEISVFQVPELSRTVRVDAQGLISLPMIGPTQAAALTARELEMLLAKRLSEKYLQDPQVSVFIKEYVSQRVVVEGSVLKPGVYPITGRTTLVQAVALAGGPNNVANPASVRIIRIKPDGARDVAVYNLEVIRAGSVEDPLIQGNDIVVMDESGGRAFLRDFGELMRSISPFGMFR